MNGHRELETPVPISNTEVKQLRVLGCTALQGGNPG